MAIARHRLDVLFLPLDPTDRGWASAAAQRLGAAGRWPAGVVDGAVARVVAAPDVRFLSNHQGGFFVRCPVTGANVAAPFSSALERWRTGGPRGLSCSCGREHDLATLAFSPPAGFAAAWIAAEDAAAAEPGPETTALLGPHLRVWQRG